jgi:hypothetical protein
MIMQLLDQQSLLRLARCSRSLFCCASNPFGWQRLRFRVDVRGSDVIEDPRRAGSLLRFESSIAFVDQHANDPSSLVSCATLLRVPRLIALNFERSSQPLMQQSEWHSFLQHPSARRLERLNLWLQPTLCDAAGLSLLSQLPLLNALLLHLPAAAPALHLAPLANCPCLTDVRLCGPMEAFPAPLEPLAGCIRLRSLTLHGLALRVGQLSALFMRLAQAGSQLRELRLFHLRMLPMNDSVLDVAREPADDAVSLELLLAAHSLTHLRALWLFGVSGVLDCVLFLPLRMLKLSLDFLPSAMKLEFLLRRLPHLHCDIRCRDPIDHTMQQQNAAMLPQLEQLAQQCSRLTITEASVSVGAL